MNEDKTVKLPTNTAMSIRLRSVEMVGEAHREAIISFEMFAYPANNGGTDCPVVVLSKTVPYSSQDPTSTLRPDYDLMVTTAANALVEDFKRMADVLGRIAHTD